MSLKALKDDLLKSKYKKHISWERSRLEHVVSLGREYDSWKKVLDLIKSMRLDAS